MNVTQEDILSFRNFLSKKLIMKSKSRFVQKSIMFLVIIFVCYVNYLTITQSRNVFFMDDWGTPGSIFYSYLSGDLDFDDLLSQHNESRPILSKVYSLLLLESGIFSTQYAVYLRITLSFIIGLLIYRLSKPVMKNYSILFFSFILIIVFIPTQCYNMLFGMTFIGLIIPLAILLSVLLIFSDKSSLKKFFIISLLCIISTFTYANGMMMWILVNPFLFNRFIDSKHRLSFYYSIIFTFLGFIFIFYYFKDYSHPQSHPDIKSGFNDPLRMLHFFAILIWSPFAISWNKYLLSTVILSLSLLFLIMHYRSYLIDLFMKRVHLNRFQCAMFMILIYGLITCLSIAFGRCGFGLKFALSEQYPSYAIWIHLPIIGLVLSVFGNKIKPVGKHLIIFYLILYVLSIEASFQRMKDVGGRYKVAESAIYFANVIPNNPFLRVATNNPTTNLLPKLNLFKDNNLANVYDPALFSLDIINAKSIEGYFNYRSDGSSIFFNGSALNPINYSDFDHLILFDVDLNDSYKPIVATCFNKTNKTFSIKKGLSIETLTAFDHSISSNINFVDPVAIAVDISNNKIYRIKGSQQKYR